MLSKNWLVQKQTAFGKDSSNPFMADNFPNIVWFSTHHITCMKSWLVQKQTALGQTVTGKESSNPFMAGSLPKTILYSFLHKICSHSDAAGGFEQIIDFLSGSYIHHDLTVNPHVYISCIKQFGNTDVVKCSGVICLPNDETFVGLARMGYEKPSTKLTFYKAFFSTQWKFFIHTILHSLSANRTSWNEFSSTMASALISLSSGQRFNFSKYIFESLVRNEEVQVPAQDDVVQEHVIEEIATEVVPPTPTSPSPSSPVLDKCSALVLRVEGLENANAVQQLEITKLKARVKKLERLNKGRMSVDMETDEGIELEVDQEKNAEVEGRHGDKQPEIYNIDLDHSLKVLSMQEDTKVQEAVEVVTTAKLLTEVVTAAATQVAAASTPVPAAKPKTLKIAAALAVSTRRRKGVVIRYLEEELHTDTQAETPTVKDKGKGILIEDPKPMKKKDQTREEMEKEDEEIIKIINETPVQKAAKRRKLSEEAQEVDDLRRRFGDCVSTEDANQEFLRSLPSSWSNISLIMKNKPGIDNLDIDDLYNNLKVYKADIKGSSGSSSNSQNVAFVFAESTNSTNELNVAYSVCIAIGHSSEAQGSSSYVDELMFSFFTNQPSSPQLDNKDLEQVDQDDWEEMDLKWQVAMLSMRVKDYRLARNLRNKSRDAGKVGYRGRDNEEEATDFALMAFTSNPSSSSSSNSKVQSCSIQCEQSYEQLKTLFDEHCKKLSKANIEMIGYHSPFNEKEVLDIKEEEVTETMFDNRSSDKKNSLANDRFKKNEGYHVVSPPFTRNYMPPKSDVSFARLDDFIYKFKISEIVAILIKDEKDAPETKIICVEKPKEDRSSALLIYDWDTDSDNDNSFRPELIPAKIDFVKAGESVKHGKGTRQRESRLVLSNVQRINHQNKFAPTTIFTRFGRIPISAVKLKATTSTSAAKPVNTARPKQWNKAYLVNYQEINNGGFVAFGLSRGKITDKASIDESNLWHIRLGHVNFKTMNKLVTENLVRGLPSKIFDNDHSCVTCQKGTQHKATCKAKLVSLISQPLQMLHMDLFGPTSVMNINYKKYYLVVTDDFSRDLDEFCGMKRIKREYSNARTPQQNKVAERKNSTLIEVARTMLPDSLLPIIFWAEVVNTVCYVLNRVLATKTHNKTLYELLNDRRPRLDFMRPFGCPVTILNTLDSLGKFKGTQGNVDAGKEVSDQHYIILPLCSSISSTFKCLNDKAKDDRNKDDTENKASDITDALRKEFEQGCMDQRGVTKAGSTNSFNTVSNLVNAACTSGTFSANGLSSPPTDAFILFNTLLHVDQDDSQIPDLEDTVELQSTGKEGQIIKIMRTTYLHASSDRWNPKRNKKDEMDIVVRNKARLVAQGHIQEEGIDYDEIFAHVARIEAIRIFLAFASFMGFIVYQMDVKITSLYGTIKEEVYACQPPRFIDLWFLNKVYKVEKALYDLHQAPRAWYETLSTFLLQNGYRKGTIDMTLFIKKDMDDIMLVQRSSMGELILFLGLQVNQSKKGILISQDKSSSKLSRDQTSNSTSSTNPTLKGRIRRSSKQKVENLNFEENPLPPILMAENQTMTQLLQAPTDGYEDAIVIPEIAKRRPARLPPLLQQDHLYNEAWDRFKYLLRACPHHGFFELHQLDTFYNALNVNDQDSLNSAAGENFLDKMPADCLKIIESKSKVRQTRAKAVLAKVSSNSSTPYVSADVAELKDMVRALLLDKKNQYLAQTSCPTPAPIKAIEPNCVTCGGNHAYQNCPATNGNVYQDNIQETLPGNTVTNPKEDLKAPVQPTVTQSESETPVSEPVVAPVSASMPNLKPSIPYPSRCDTERRRDQANKQIEKFYEIFKEMSFKISFTDALILMPKFASTLKSLIGNKEKLSEMAWTPINEHSLADLGASINLMPLSVWKGLSLPELTPTCMTLELADRTESKPVGISKDVKVKVGMFHFPADFVVVDFEPDPQVPLILGRCFLKTSRALIDVQKEVLSFSDVTTSGCPTLSDDPIVSTTSPTLTPFGDSDFLLFEEADAFFGLEDDPDSPELGPSYYDLEGDILSLKAILNSDPSPPLPNHEQSVPSFKEELKACEAKTIKSSIDEPPEVELKGLPLHLEYAFLEGDNKLLVIIAKTLKDEEKSALIKVLKSHKRAIAWKLSDIQGINLEFCTHKILMDEDYKPAVQNQK
uniref:Integrase catalytic domain-containing protein n=1 Tax=Tanacetum cinerariifolium TaxID=118510 RepID=A0A6L2MDD6_TANCI|nr:hypothetical protein [Tanacetum cinerariifolium]